MGMEAAMKTWMKRALIVVIPLAVAAAAIGWYMRGSTPKAAVYRTAEVTRGDLAVTITATGTIEPEEVIDVGAQVAGQILSFGRDEKGKTIDYGSAVKEGMVLAKIDDCLWAADLASTEAQMAQYYYGVYTSKSGEKTGGGTGIAPSDGTANGVGAPAVTSVGTPGQDIGSPT